MDPNHYRLLKGARLSGRGLRGVSRTPVCARLGRVARSPGRRGRTACGAERAVGGEYVTLAIERRWACRAARRRLAGRRTIELFATRPGRLRRDLEHLRAHNGASGSPLRLAVSGRRREDNRRTAEWTVTNSCGTLHATNFVELRTGEVRRIYLPRGWVNT